MEELQAMIESLSGSAPGLAGLSGMLDGLKGSISGIGGALKGLTSQQDAANNGLRQGRDALGHFTSAGQGASSAMGKGFEAIASGAKAVTPAIAALGSTVVSLATGPIPSAQQAMDALGSTLGGTITGATEKLGTALSGLGPEGAAAGAAIEAVGAAAGAAVGSMTTLMGLAIETTEKMSLLKDSFAGLAGGAAGGAAVQSMIAKLNLPFATSEVNAWAASLVGAGVSGQKLANELQAIASAQALTQAFGGQGGAAAEKFFKQMGNGGKEADELLKKIAQGGRRGSETIKAMGLNIADLGGQAAVAKMSAEELTKAVTEALKKKGKGPLEDIAGSMTSILTKAQEGIRSLFGNLGPAVKPFMAAVKSLFGEFNKGGGAIKFLQPIVTAVMTTLFSWGTRAVGVVHDIMTWLLNSGKAGGMFSGVVKAIHVGWAALVSIFGIVKTALAPMIGMLKAIFSNALVLRGIKMIFTVIAGAIMVVVVVIAALVAAAVTMAAAIAGAFAAVVGVVAGAVGGIVDALSGFDFSAFISKMGDMAKAGLAAFKGVFGIASPSSVLLEHGEDDMAGAAATGVDKGAGKLKQSMKKMGDDATPPKGKGVGKDQKSGGDGGPSFEFNNCNFGGTDESSIRRMMKKVWAELAGEAGAQPQGAT